MRQQILTAAVIGLATVSSSFAADSIVPPSPDATQAVSVEATAETTVKSDDTVIRGQSQRSTVRRSSNRGGFFNRMMELERRKNAWLRRTFLNR